MLPYWFIFGLFAYGSLGWHVGRSTKSSLPLALAAVILTFFIGLRYEIGADWEGYLFVFNYTRSMSLENIVQEFGDPGFYFLVWLINILGYEIWALNLVCAILFMIGLFAFSRRTPNPWLSIAVAFPYLVLVVAMSGMRQATAIGLYFLALNAFSGRRLGVAVTWMLLASLFHASAIVILGVAALSFTRNRLQSALILIVTIGVGYFAFRSSFEIYLDRYSKLIQSSGTIIRLMMNLIPALIFLKYKSKFNLAQHEQTFWRNLSLLSILFFPMYFIIPSSTALDRFSLYLIPLQCFVLSGSAFLFGRGPNQARLVTGSVLGYLATAMFVFLNYSATAEAWNNYRLYPTANVVDNATSGS